MKLLAALATALLGFGCSSAVPPSSSNSEPSVAPAPRRSLGSLRTRDREIVIHASPGGVKVTVKASNGAILADGVDLDALRTIDPDVYNIVRSGVANGGPYLDATLDRPIRPAEAVGEHDFAVSGAKGGVRTIWPHHP
jgi:hypothetical protein